MEEDKENQSQMSTTRQYNAQRKGQLEYDEVSLNRSWHTFLNSLEYV
jgi:hypothetical protein